MSRITFTMKALNIFTGLLLLATLSACGEGDYEEHNGTICHSYWTFSFGYVYNPLPEVDMPTFQRIKSWLGRDKNHVYFKDNIIPGAHPGFIEAEKYPYSHDNKDYYYMNVPLHVNSVKAFTVIRMDDYDGWAVDGRYAYYDSIRIETRNLSSFKVHDYCVATDCDHVYRFGEVLPEADPATYVEQWKGDYSRDKSHIWYYGTMLEDVDYATFTVDDDGAHDKHGHFHYDKRISEEEWKEIKQWQ